ncbi:hypothetical protein CEK00_09405 [Stenotrophomonas maltophilia]|uniref:Uncharacterized protein n=1 Tax=Stenotrophomonas maltophilia TaxID=40324 RepID=A0A270NI99_STEMA|nr:hypothetical protein CEK00_21725 [Stenotrophomonas maltophilia]PAM71799.1 hypothetical protein CEK00_09405 [Stenotrophomonas maltophilia]
MALTCERLAEALASHPRKNRGAAAEGICNLLPHSAYAIWLRKRTSWECTPSVLFKTATRIT